MTCKDCIHSGLCYKENDFNDFPDRCGNKISIVYTGHTKRRKMIYRYKIECERCKRTIGYISLSLVAIDNNYTIKRTSVNNKYFEPILCPSCEEKRLSWEE